MREACRVSGDRGGGGGGGGGGRTDLCSWRSWRTRNSRSVAWAASQDQRQASADRSVAQRHSARFRLSTQRAGTRGQPAAGRRRRSSTHANRNAANFVIRGDHAESLAIHKQ